MANKELTAKVKLDTRDAESKLKRITNLINSLNSSLNKANKVEMLERNRIAKEEQAIDRLLQKEMNALHKKQQAQWTAFQKEQMAYEKQLAKQEQIKQKELETERIRQQSLKTLGDGDRAAQNLLRVTQQRKRAEQDAMYAAMFTKLEWQKSHPILSRLAKLWDNIKAKIQQVCSKSPLLSRVFSTVHSKTSGIISKVQNWLSNHRKLEDSAKRLNKHYQQGGNLINMMSGKIRNLISTYLGVLGMKGIINTSDSMTSAQNKLNYTSAQNLGNKAYNTDGSYSTATLNATQDALDKMYVSSQKVRMNYDDMMANVSKSMALAGDAFHYSTDNAIRFQEIMAEAYAVGGASAEEMSSSMYQLIQALGSGVLAGDELRSLREGAPLAYKEIEKFVQGVYNTEESLKDLASQGKVTSDMVIASILNAGNTMDKAFAQTAQTFAQTWSQIKSAAQYAFLPISNMMRDMLNKLIDNGFINKVESFFNAIAKVIQIAFKLIEQAISWVANNWYWLQDVIVMGLIVMATYFIITKTIAIASAIATATAWLIANWYLVLIVATLALLIYGFYKVMQGAATMSEFLVWCAVVIATAFLIAGMIMFNIPMLVIAAILILLAVVFNFFEQVCYGAAWLAAWIVNIVFGILNFIITCGYLLLTAIWNIITLIVNSIGAAIMFVATIIQWIVSFIVNLVMGCANSIVAISHNCVAAICNVAMGLGNSIGAICQNIGIAFSNAWTWAKNTFWEFIADVLDGVSKLEPVINGIASLLGKEGIDFGGLASAARSKKGEYKSYVSVGNAWTSGMNSVAYKDVGDAWSSGWNTMDYTNMGNMVSKGWNTMEFASFGDAINSGMNTLDYVDANKWGTNAANWGADKKAAINAWGENLTNNIGDKLNLNDIGEQLGLDFNNKSDVEKLSKILGDDQAAKDLLKNNPDKANKLLGKNGSGFPNVGNPAYALDTTPVEDLLGDISDGVNGISDTIELSQDDLEFLRDVANMEWKKEFTTAEIKVDMSNYNTVNGESDLDGIVTKLTDKLYEELQSVADGVYV